MTGLRELMGLLHRTAKEHHLACENAAKIYPLHRAQHILLMRLSQFKTPPSQKQLAEELNISTAAAALALNRLEQAGFIRKMPDENDSRINLIALTEAGKKAVFDSIQAFDEIDEKAFCGVTEEEKVLLTAVLNKILHNLKKN